MVYLSKKLHPCIAMHWVLSHLKDFCYIHVCACIYYRHVI